MTISFETGTSGWARYVIQGTREEIRDQSKIEVLENDPYFVEKIANQNKFSGEYYKIVISAEKKLSNDEMKEIYQELKKELFIGLSEDEFICSAVLHQDTDYSHIHIIVPKQNLLTEQHLQLYMYGIDTKRMDLIADTIALKHNLKTKEEAKPTIQKPKEHSFEKQREERNQEPFSFTLISKKEKALAEQQVTELLKENINSINSLDEVKQFIEKNTNLKVVNDGYERKKQFHYVTVQDEKGKKTRIKGELFSEEYFKQTKPNQKQQLKENTKTFTEVEKETIAKQIRANLKRENEKRYKVVQKLFKHGRPKAYAEQKKIQIKGKINEYSTEQRTAARVQERDSREVPRANQKSETLINMRTMSNINLLCDRQPKLLLSEDKQPNSISRDNTRDDNKRVFTTTTRSPEATTGTRETAKRGEINDSPGTNARTSKTESTATRTEQRAERTRSTRRRAISLHKERIAAFKEIRRARERVLTENERTAENIRKEREYDSLTIRTKYEIYDRETERKNQNIVERAVRAVRTVKSKFRELVNKKYSALVKEFDLEMTKLETLPIHPSREHIYDNYVEKWKNKELKEEDLAQLKKELKADEKAYKHELLKEKIQKVKHKKQDLGRSR